MKKVIINLFLLFSVVYCSAQKDSSSLKEAAKKKYVFHSINQIGIVEGAAATKPLLQTVNGIQLERWFAGIGTGIDYYAYRTIPLFLDVRRNLSNKRMTPFAYADVGMNFPWTPGRVKDEWFSSKFKNGYYYDLGIGYTIGTKNSGGFLISLGYSEKQYSEIRENPSIYSFPSPTNRTKFNYQLRRISIKAGWKF